MSLRITPSIVLSLAVLVGIGAMALFPVAVRGQDAPSTTLSATEVAEQLDTIMQSRFTDPSLLNNGMVGGDRLFRLTGHPRIRFWQGGEKEKERFRPIQESGREFLIAFYQTKPFPKPAKIPKGQEAQLREAMADLRFRHVDASGDLFLGRAPARIEWRQMVEKAKSQWERGEKVSKDTPDWYLAFRPVPARKECLSCHKEKKVGDTLGLMFYAVAKAANPVTAKQATASNP